MNYAANIADYWQAHVSANDLRAGEEAYPAYQEMIKRISDHYGVPFVGAVEAFAALSPANDYYGNLRSLVSLIVGVQKNEPYTISTFKACGRRAEGYLKGEVSFLDTVKGRKITAFRNCIIDPLCGDFVLDGHMISIALGEKLTMAEANLRLREHGYDPLADAYVDFATDVNKQVTTLQAALWYCRKRVEKIKFSLQTDFWYDDARLLYPVEDVPPYKQKDA